MGIGEGCIVMPENTFIELHKRGREEKKKGGKKKGKRRNDEGSEEGSRTEGKDKSRIEGKKGT